MQKKSCAASFSIKYERVGADLIFECNTTLRDVEWQLNGRKIEDTASTYTNGTHLTLLNVKKDQGGNYSCHVIGTKHIVAQTELKLGYPPEKLQAQCWAMSYPEKLQCTWDLRPDVLLHTTFITTYRLGLISSESPNQCVQSDRELHSCLISDFQMFSDYPYLLNVTAINPLGSVTLLVPFIIENIIRPDPPENVTASSLVGEKRKLLLSWCAPHSWPYPEHFPLMYMIRYKRLDGKPYRVIGPYELTTFILVGLKPGSVVQAQVAAKDITDYGEYSKWSAAGTGQPWMQS
ncbi:interleukin-27 subunit beta [Pelodytes ibericus]